MERRNRIRIAAPCHASWRSMEGDDKVRHCTLCKLNVYNLSAMSAGEIGQVLERTNGRTCVRFYHRRDGKVLTRNCPAGLREMRRRLALSVCLTTVSVLSIFSVAMARTRAESRSPEDLVDAARGWPVVGPIIERLDPQPVMGAIAVPPTYYIPAPKAGP